MAVTLKDIADDLGLAVITVSKVLRNHSDIGAATRARVLERAKELNYQPNRAARSLVTGRSFTIALVVPDLEHPFFGEIAKAIAGKLRVKDYSLLISCSEEDPSIETLEIEALIARQIDAVILATVQTSVTSGIFKRLEEAHTPYILIDRNFPDLQANYVGVDDVAVGRAATEHLILGGRRRIAHLRGPEVSTGIGRLEGYKAALKQHRLKVPAHYVVDLKRGDNRSEEYGFEAMRKLLEHPVRPDGVFCYNDEVAIGALRALFKAHIRVPKEIAVIGVDNIRFADLLRVPLSSIDQNSYRIGEHAAELALALVESKNSVAPRQIILPVQLVGRTSSQGGT